MHLTIASLSHYSEASPWCIEGPLRPCAPSILIPVPNLHRVKELSSGLSWGETVVNSAQSNKAFVPPVSEAEGTSWNIHLSQSIKYIAQVLMILILGVKEQGAPHPC